MATSTIKNDDRFVVVTTTLPNVTGSQVDIYNLGSNNYIIVGYAVNFGGTVYQWQYNNVIVELLINSSGYLACKISNNDVKNLPIKVVLLKTTW